MPRHSHLRLVREGDPVPCFDPVSVGPADCIAGRLPVFAAHKRDLAGWLRKHVEVRIQQKRPVELSYGVAREIADLIEFGGNGAA